MSTLIQRRSFISKLSATTLAGAGAGAVTGAVAAAAPETTTSPPARREAEDHNAIRHLHQTFVADVNSARRTPLPEHATYILSNPQHPDTITIAPDGQSATARFHALVKIEHPIDSNMPLVEMAREQGGAIIKSWQSGAFENSYKKRADTWQLEKLTYRPYSDCKNATNSSFCSGVSPI